MSTQNNRTARDYLAALFASDQVAMRQTLTRNCKIWLPQSVRATSSPENPLVGRDRIADQLSGIASSPPFAHKALKFDVLHAVAEADFVVMNFRLQSLTNGEATYDKTHVFLFRFEDGKIAECWEQIDTAYAFATLRGGQAQAAD